jgi:tetratricopeptide (TPR) repeat protein
MIGCPRLWRIATLFTGIAALALSLARAERVEPLPRDSATVGIMPFRGPEDQVRTGSELLRELLEAYGFKVKTLADLDDPREAFEVEDELDFIVRGLIGGDMASALVYPRSAESVRRLESTAEKPVRDLAAKILRHVSSESSIESIVATRKERASAKLKESPRDYDSLVLMGLAMRHEGNIAEAIRYFEQAIAVNPNDPDAHYSLALSLERSGQSQQATKQQKTALRLDTHHEAAGIALTNNKMDAGDVN